MPLQWTQIIAGLLLGAGVATAAYRLKALTRGGAAAAAVLGGVFFGLGGLEGAVLLLVFFISSSALSRLAKSRKKEVEANYAKGDRRDLGQVLANGGAAGVFMVLHAFFPLQTWPWLGAAAALAAANADTWATELGVLSPHPPRLITSGRRVTPCASGGVSVVGMGAALAGAALEAAAFVIVWPGGGLLSGPLTPHNLSLSAAFFMLVTLCGLVGSMVDSLLGATLQAIYFCPACHKETERHPIHACGTPTTLLRGFAWMNNDWVNTACTVSGAVAGILLYLVI